MNVEIVMNIIIDPDPKIHFQLWYEWLSFFGMMHCVMLSHEYYLRVKYYNCFFHRRHFLLWYDGSQSLEHSSENWCFHRLTFDIVLCDVPQAHSAFRKAQSEGTTSPYWICGYCRAYVKQSKMSLKQLCRLLNVNGKCSPYPISYGSKLW